MPFINKTLISVISGLLIACSVAHAGSEIAERPIIYFIKGTVHILPTNTQNWQIAEVAMPVKDGYRLKAGAGSYCDISFDADNKNIVGVRENSEVIFLGAGDEKLQLINGAVYGKISSMKKGSSFIVKTPTGICGARGTGFGIQCLQGITKLMVFQDKVFLKTIKGNEAIVPEGFMRQADAKSGISKQTVVPEEEKIKFNGWTELIPTNIMNIKATREKLSKISKQAEVNRSDLEDILN